MSFFRVVRSVIEAATSSVLSLRRVDIYLQKYPGKDAASGVADIPYTVTVGGTRVSPANARTASDGKMSIRLPAGATATLRIMDTDIQVTLRDTLEAVTTRHGRQRRLSMLGYQLGPNGVDGQRGQYTDRAVLNFQADHHPLTVDGDPGSNTRTRLTNEVGE